jgi:hypothetical protein
MVEYRVSLTAILLTLENGEHWGEALFFPEVSCFRPRVAAFEQGVRKLAAAVVKQTPAVELHGRQTPAECELSKVSLVVEPPKRTRAWSRGVALEFDVVMWSRDAALQCAWVPSLRIEVAAATGEELSVRLESEIREALIRTKALTSLRQLVWLQRRRRARLLNLAVAAALPSPKEAAREKRNAQRRTASVLKEVASDLTTERLPEAYEATAAVLEMVRRRRELQLDGRSF